MEFCNSYLGPKALLPWTSLFNAKFPAEKWSRTKINAPANWWIENSILGLTLHYHEYLHMCDVMQLQLNPSSILPSVRNSGFVVVRKTRSCCMRAWYTMPQRARGLKARQPIRIQIRDLGRGVPLRERESSLFWVSVTRSDGGTFFLFLLFLLFFFKEIKR